MWRYTLYFSVQFVNMLIVDLAGESVRPSSEMLWKGVEIGKPTDFIPVSNGTSINFNEVNWVGFIEFTENTFTAVPILADVIVGES